MLIYRREKTISWAMMAHHFCCFIYKTPEKNCSTVAFKINLDQLIPPFSFAFGHCKYVNGIQMLPT